MSGYLAIDPGFNTGWAYWEKKLPKAEMPNYTGLVKPAKGITGDDRSIDVTVRMVERIQHVDPEHIYIERPEIYGSGKALASALRGDISKLLLTVGCIAGGAAALGYLVHFIPVRDWKGQLSDHATDKRIALTLGIRNKDFKEACPNEHIRDAIGIGLHGMGWEL